MEFKNEYEIAINKLLEIEDAKILYHLADFFKHKADCMASLEDFLKQLKKEQF